MSITTEAKKKNAAAAAAAAAATNADVDACHQEHYEPHFSGIEEGITHYSRYRYIFFYAVCRSLKLRNRPRSIREKERNSQEPNNRRHYREKTLSIVISTFGTA